MIIDTLMVLWSLIRRAKCVKVFSLLLMTGISMLLVLFAIGLPLFSRQSLLDSHALMRKLAHGHALRMIHTTPVVITPEATMASALSSVPFLPRTVTVVPTPASAFLTPATSDAVPPCILPSTPVPPPGRLPMMLTPVVSPDASPTQISTVPTIVPVTPTWMPASVPTMSPTLAAVADPTPYGTGGTATPQPSVPPTVVVTMVPLVPVLATATVPAIPGTMIPVVTVTPAVTPDSSPKSSIGEMERKTLTSIGTGTLAAFSDVRLSPHRSFSHALGVPASLPHRKSPPEPIMHCYHAQS